jgi:hypothetical protein
VTAGTGDAGTGGAAASTPAVSDAVSAMLATALPGASFADPLGGIDYQAAEGSGIPEGQADASTAPKDADPPSANGSEAAG